MVATTPPPGRAEAGTVRARRAGGSLAWALGTGVDRAGRRVGRRVEGGGAEGRRGGEAERRRGGGAEGRRGGRCGARWGLVIYGPLSPRLSPTRRRSLPTLLSGMALPPVGARSETRRACSEGRSLAPPTPACELGVGFGLGLDLEGQASRDELLIGFRTS
ncbi:hypothetical protein JHW43_008514, partial [Diplocarpon mali]